MTCAPGGSGSVAPLEIAGDDGHSPAGGLCAVVKNGASVTGGNGRSKYGY